jgi:hypothetical protein
MKNNNKIKYLDNGFYEKKVGTTCVDSGTICITDPCYIIDRYNEDKYIDMANRLGNDNNYTPLFYPDIHLGVVHSTRYGDGEYPIIATYDKDDLVVSVRVDFGTK